MNPAWDKVKVGEFCRRGIDIRGIVHVGANDGYEIPTYLEMGVGNILCFEPLTEAWERYRSRHGDDPQVRTILCALANFDGQAEFKVTQADGQGSSLLDPMIQEETAPLHYVVEQRRIVQVARFDTLVSQGRVNPDLYNCLVVDVQGMELPVLEGFGPYLSLFDCLCVECSAKPIYVGGVEAGAVLNHCECYGFRAVTPTRDHDDVLFIKIL